MPVFWLQTPDDDDEETLDPYLVIRVRDNWLATDGDQLILPIDVLERSGESVEETGLLKQYGGERLLNDMLLADQELEPGSEWIISIGPDQQTTISPVPPTETTE